MHEEIAPVVAQPQFFLMQLCYIHTVNLLSARHLATHDFTQMRQNRHLKGEVIGSTHAPLLHCTSSQAINATARKMTLFA
jgi:hypothetical protein